MIEGNRRLHFARAVHSRHPLPADRRCCLSSTCRKRTEPRTRTTCTKNGKDRACGSGDILSDRQRDWQTHRQMHSSQ